MGGRTEIGNRRGQATLCRRAPRFLDLSEPAAHHDQYAALNGPWCLQLQRLVADWLQSVRFSGSWTAVGMNGQLAQGSLRVRFVQTFAREVGRLLVRDLNLPEIPGFCPQT